MFGIKLLITTLLFMVMGVLYLILLDKEIYWGFNKRGIFEKVVFILYVLAITLFGVVLWLN